MQGFGMTKVTNSKAPMAKLSPTIENYLSLIYVLERDDQPVVGVQVAELMKVTPPTVTNTLKRMARDGLVSMDKTGVRLTKAGRESARTVTRRHMLTEWMMARMLPWSKLHQEAHNLEHAISAEVEAALFEQLGEPQTCPHGNPLPGAEKAVAGWIPLTETAAGERVTIRRVHEVAEYNLELMGYFESNGIVPGAAAVIREVLPFNGTISLEIDGRAITLGFGSARYVFVERER
jgi:DtxR family Mn-dependent transcriptional regulator